MLNHYLNSNISITFLVGGGRGEGKSGRCSRGRENYVAGRQKTIVVGRHLQRSKPIHGRFFFSCWQARFAAMEGCVRRSQLAILQEAELGIVLWIWRGFHEFSDGFTSAIHTYNMKMWPKTVYTEQAFFSFPCIALCNGAAVAGWKMGALTRCPTRSSEDAPGFSGTGGECADERMSASQAT